MTNKRSLATMAALLATTLGGTMAFAQTPVPSPSTPSPAPMAGPGMMPGGGMLGPADMAEMRKRRENCNKMMERAAQAAPPNPAAPDRKG